VRLRRVDSRLPSRPEDETTNGRPGSEAWPWSNGAVSHQTPDRKGPSTIREVAAAAGVSLATVSRVLSGARSTEDTMAKRVLSAASELDFRPNPGAQSLRRPVSTVGVIVPDLANPYFAEVLKGVSGAAEAAGQRMLVADSGENPAEEIRLVRELARWTSGVILCSPRMASRRLTEASSRVSRMVLINRKTTGHPSVAVDFGAGIGDICAHLRGLGHEHLVYLQGPAGSRSDAERRRALRAQARRGLRIDFLTCGPGTTDGYAATDAALATGASAIVAFSDYVAIGVLIRAGELRLRIPEDVSITGFDDIPVSGLIGPGLTTASVSKTNLGRLAHELLSCADVDRRVIVRPTLVVRGSTGPPATSPRIAVGKPAPSQAGSRSAQVGTLDRLGPLNRQINSTTEHEGPVRQPPTPVR